MRAGRASSSRRRGLHTEKLFADAVSRAYYAVMHAAKAALLTRGVVAESHGAVRRQFGLVLVRAGLIETEWADILADERDERVAADYSISVIWEAPASSRLLEDARVFVQRMREYLESGGISIPK